MLYNNGLVGAGFMVKDYYEPLKFNEVFSLVKSFEKPNSYCYYEFFRVYGSKYKLDRKGYLAFIIGKYANNVFKEDYATDYLSHHPYVIGFDLDECVKHVYTVLGEVQFSLCISSLKVALIDKRSRILADVYLGKYVNKCHEISAILGTSYECITTAFVNSPIKDYKYLHSFVEDGNYVFDFARNMKLLKDDYYDLLEPEVTSKIEGSQFVTDLKYVRDNYSSMTSKDFLVKHDELVLTR